jgi:FtsH-binding integral membrane protein
MQLDFVISAAGVLIFAGMTAWDTQRLKEMYDPLSDHRPARRQVRSAFQPQGNRLAAVVTAAVPRQ